MQINLTHLVHRHTFDKATKGLAKPSDNASGVKVSQASTQVGCIHKYYCRALSLVGGPELSICLCFHDVSMYSADSIMCLVRPS